MARRNKFGSIIITTTSFLGGIALGILLAPKSGRKSRAWINDQATELANWMDSQGKTVAIKSHKKLKNIRKKLQHNVQKNVPDLYRATERINLSHENELRG